MIKFRGNTPNGPLYGLGLSRENIDRLTAGMPIKVDMRDMGGPAIHLVITFGETERAIYEELKASGMLHPDIEYREPDPDEVIVQRVKSDPPTE